MDNGRLRYQGPVGAVTQNELERIRALKEEIIALLERRSSSASGDAPLVPREPSDQVPLTFLQRQIWSLFGLAERLVELRPAPVRLLGSLSVESLRVAFAEVVRRHEALRTRMLGSDGILRQEVDDADLFTLELVQLNDEQMSCREVAAKHYISQRCAKLVDPSLGPLFAATLLKLDDEDHVLVVFWEHTLVDIFSLGILWREIWSIYLQSLRGLPLSLPKVPIQFADFAVWEQRTNESWMAKHYAYWSGRFVGAPHLRMFREERIEKIQSPRLKLLTIEFEKFLITELREWSRCKGTSLMMGFLTAYVASVLRWCVSEDVIVYVPSVGRLHSELENTIGNFSSGMFLRVEISEGDSFLDLLRSVVKEYAAAYENSNFFRAQIPVQKVNRHTVFNWFSREYDADPGVYFEELDAEMLGDVVKVKPFTVEILPRDYDSEWGVDINFGLYETKEGVTGYIGYHADLVSLATIERFTGELQRALRALVKMPETCVVAMCGDERSPGHLASRPDLSSV